MASANPPIYNFNGLNYNSQFYQSSLDNAYYVTTTTAQTISGVKQFTVSPLAPTADTADNSTTVATTEYVQNQGYLTSATASNTYVDVSSAQSVGGVKTFSSLLNANAGLAVTGTVTLPNSSITQSMVGNGYCDTSSAQNIGGVKSFTDTTQTTASNTTLSGAINCSGGISIAKSLTAFGDMVIGTNSVKRSINTQGFWLQWNRVSGNGTSYLINQIGAGTVGGFSFGESTSADVYTEKMSLNSSGNLTITGSYYGTLASTVTATTQTAGDSSQKVATTAFVGTAVSTAVGSGGTFSGTLASGVTATTQTAGTSNTSVATTAFVGTAISNNGVWTKSTNDIYYSTGKVAIGTSTISGLLNLYSSTQALSRLLLSGQEFYQASNTSTDGISFLIGVNRTNNRQLWIADSANLTQNTTNAVCRIMPNSSQVTIDAIATDGVTGLPLTLNGSSVSLNATPSSGDSSTKIATTAFVGTAISNNGVWTKATNDIYYSTGNVGIGVTPSAPLHIHRSGVGTILQLTNPNTGTASGNGLAIGYTSTYAYLWNYYNNPIQIGTSVQAMYINNSGQTILGAGTSYANSQARLTIQGTNASLNQQLHFYTTDNTLDNKIWAMGSNSNTFYCYIMKDDATGSSNWLQCTRSGNSITNVCFPNGSVGIANSSPGALLDVGSSTASAPSIRLTGQYGTSSSNYIQLGVATAAQQYSTSAAAGDCVIRTGANNLILQTTGAGASQLYLASSGNFGIGTVTPGYKLDVAGTANVSGVSTVGDGTTGYLEFGGGSNQSLIDFHGGSVATDYDARIICNSGNGTTGQGTMELVGATVKAPTPTAGDNSQKIATTAFITTALTSYAALSGAAFTGKISSTNTGVSSVSSPAAVLDLKSTNGGAAYSAHCINFYTYTTSNAPSRRITVVDNNFGGDMIFYGKTPGADANTLSEQMRIKNNGNIGIGTSSPSYLLHLYGGSASANFTGLAIQSSANTNNGIGQQLLFSLNSSGTTYNQGGIITYRENAAANYNSSLILQSSSNGTLVNAVTINSSGDVGVGTNSLTNKLEIYGGSQTTNSSATISFLPDATTIGSGKQGLWFDFNTTNQYATIQAENFGVAWRPVCINPNGANVGIGTTNPSYKLDITGSLRATSSTAVVLGVSASNPQSTNTITVTGEADSGSGNSATMTTVYGKSLKLKTPDFAGSFWNNSGGFSNTPNCYAGHLYLEAGDLNNSGDNGTAPSNQNGGNIYLTAGRSYWAGTTSNGTQGSIIFQTNNPSTECMRISGSGYVGIGVASPDSKLVIPSGGSYNTAFNIGNNGYNFISANTGQYTAFKIGDKEVLRIDGSGIANSFNLNTVTVSGSGFTPTVTTPFTKKTTRTFHYQSNGTSTSTAYIIAALNGIYGTSGTFKIELLNTTTFVTTYSGAGYFASNAVTWTSSTGFTNYSGSSWNSSTGVLTLNYNPSNNTSYFNTFITVDIFS